MTFTEVEPPIHKREDLVWFMLSPELIRSENILSQKYELNLVIHLRIDNFLLDGKLLEFGIQEGFLELKCVDCKLLRESWKLLPEIKDFISIKEKTNWTRKADIGGKYSVSDKETKLEFGLNAGGTQGEEEEVIYELTQVQMGGSEKNIIITFTAQQPDQEDNQVFNGKYGKTIGDLEVFVPKSEIHGKFRVDLDGLCATHYGGKPIKANLGLLLTRFSSKLRLFPDPVKEKLKTLTGDYLSYVKLCSS